MKKALSLALAVVLCLSLAAPALALGYGEEYAGYNPTPTQQYKDVPATHWAFQNINTCSERAWFNGYPDGTFRPEGLITREEAAKVFAVAMDLTLDDNPTPSFTDTAGIWSTAYIEATKVLFPNVQNLQGEKSFRPTKTITREETVYALVVAWKLASKTKNVDLSILNMFSDQQTISAAVKPYVAVAVQEKLVSGLPDGTFGGQKGLSRAEFAALLARALDHGYGADDTSAPQITLNKYSAKTGSETMTVTGSVTPASDVKVKLDGEAVQVASGGTFTLELDLKMGRNLFTLTAENTYGVKSNKTITVERTEDLVVTVDSYPATTSASSITVKGTVSPAANVTLTQGSQEIALTSSGSFSVELPLQLGRNTFTLNAKSSYGSTASETVTVERTENLAITLESYPATTSAGVITLNGTVSPAANVTLTQGDQEIALTSTGSFQVDLPLELGSNTFTLAAKNSSGSTASKTVTVERTENLTITLESYPARTSASSILVNGTVSPSLGATLTQGNQEVALTSTGSFQVELPLELGSNSFPFTAGNSSGSTVSETVTVERVEQLEIELNPFETIYTTPQAILTGTVSPASGAKLYVDDTEVAITSEGRFSAVLDLEEAEEEHFFRATNDLGDVAELAVELRWVDPVCTLLFDSYVERTGADSVTITGRIEDYKPEFHTMYVGFGQVGVAADGTFTIDLSLPEPEGFEYTNEFNVRVCFGDEMVAADEYLTITRLATSLDGTWLTALPLYVTVNPDDYNIETKTQYRTQTREETVTSDSSLPGWTLIKQEGRWGEWQTSQSAVASKTNRTIEPETVVVTQARTEYRYGGWHDSTNFGHFCPNMGKADRGKTFTLHYTAWSTTRQTPKYTNWQYCDNASHNHVGGRMYNGHHYWDRYGINGLAYYWEETRTIPAVTKTQYRYRDFTPENTFERWSGWSGWSDTPSSANGNTQVETRTMYRATAKR